MCGSLIIEAAELTTSDFTKLFPGHNTRSRFAATWGPRAQNAAHCGLRISDRQRSLGAGGQDSDRAGGTEQNLRQRGPASLPARRAGAGGLQAVPGGWLNPYFANRIAAATELFLQQESRLPGGQRG